MAVLPGFLRGGVQRGFGESVGAGVLDGPSRMTPPAHCSTLSVQRTVPRSLSATASLPLPRATVRPCCSTVSGGQGFARLRGPEGTMRKREALGECFPFGGA